MHYQPHPNHYPPHPTHAHDQQQFVPGPPQPPESAFDGFLNIYILPRTTEFPRRNDEELVQVARTAWDDPYNKEYRSYYEDKYARRLGEYQQKMAEWEREREREREGRDGEMELQRELPPPPPPGQQQVLSPQAGAGAGGFTSING